MKLPSVARCRLDQRRFVAQAVMQPRGDVEPRLDCRLRIGDQFGPELAAGVGDAEDERPGTRSNGLGEAHARQAEGQLAAVVPKLADALVGPKDGETTRRLDSDLVIHIAEVKQIGSGDHQQDRTSPRLTYNHYCAA